MQAIQALNSWLSPPLTLTLSWNLQNQPWLEMSSHPGVNSLAEMRIRALLNIILGLEQRLFLCSLSQDGWWVQHTLFHHACLSHEESWRDKHKHTVTTKPIEEYCVWWLWLYMNQIDYTRLNDCKCAITGLIKCCLNSCCSRLRYKTKCMRSVYFLDLYSGSFHAVNAAEMSPFCHNALASLKPGHTSDQISLRGITVKET